MKMFTSSHIRLHILRSGEVKRDLAKQARFRNDLIAKVDGRHPQCGDMLWCIVLGKYFPFENMVALHLFPRHHGQELMIAIFSPDAKEKLFYPNNGILVSNGIEKRLEKGLLYFLLDINFSS